MKGIILAGGLGTRLAPLTNYVSKCMLPVAGKPLVQHNIETMVRSGIRDLCVVTRPDVASQYAMAFGDGSKLGCDLTLRFQDMPAGIAHAMVAAARWAGESNVLVLLGDSIFGHPFSGEIAWMDGTSHENASFDSLIFYTKESNPSWCAQIEWVDHRGDRIRDIHEKPKEIVSHDVIPGCYMYRPDVWERIRMLGYSERGELEVTDLNRSYLRDGRLRAVPYTGLWHDAGTDMQAYLEAQTLEL